MSKSQENKAQAFQSAQSLAVETSRKVSESRDATGRLMVDAGLALVEAIRVGAVTFDAIRSTEQKTAAAALGIWSKTETARRMGVSGATLTKYRNVGLAVQAGVTPDTHGADWTHFTEAAASKWVSDAVQTPGGKAKRQAAIIRAIADHRPGAGKGDQKNGQTATKTPKPAADKGAATTVTKETVVNDARRLAEYLGSKTRRAGLDSETWSALAAYVETIAECVEAGNHERAAKVAKPTAPSKVA